MCGRVIIAESPEIVRELHLKYANELDRPADLNGPPTIQLPLFTDEKPEELQYYRWSLIPWWAKEIPKFSTFNAKLENLNVSGTWRHLIGKRHCVIITDGFYEWQKFEDKKAKKQPYLIRTQGERFTLMAGLWDSWTDKTSGEIINSCTIITRPPNQMMKQIHDRMPAILTHDQSKLWVDAEFPLNDRMHLLNDVPEDRLKAVPIEKVGEIDQYAKLFTYC